ncbi:hypothetical protein FVEG_12709 [Fusarium verticillioides 7600]|nr:hypothetical protein FVEG_12709 [Fusarium verticillioides 7600]EWG54500.1 hypothetical protein FVEG_12709 [Fusarium verticillioides 7600]
MKLDELRNLMIGYRISPQGPLLNAPLDDEDRQELSAAFLRSAEIGNRPWASIAIDDWLQAGKWWLLKVRSQMNRLAEGTEIKAHAYVNLLKACWILADIVSIHPQRVHLGASNDRRNEDIRNLSQIAKRNLEDFPVFEFELHDVKENAINIWPQSPPLETIAPRRQFGINRDNLGLQTSNGEVLFQCFAEIHRTTEGTVDTEDISEECLLMLEVPRQGINLNVRLKSFVAHEICWMRNSDALKAILRGFQLFSLAFRPNFLTASMVHSISVLRNWPSGDWNCLLFRNYDISCPARSDPLAMLLRTIVDHVVKKGYEDKSSRSEFLVRDCIDVEFLPPETFVWKVICWHCKRFADMKLLLEGFYIMLRLHDPLIQSAFLRLDRHFLDQMEYYLNQIVHYLNHRDGWCPDDVLIMVKAALRSNDAGYLLWILEHVNAATLSDHQTAIFQLVYNSRRLGHIDAMIQVIVPRPADIAAALAWYLSSSDEQSFGDFLHMVEVRGGYFKGKTTEEIDLSNFYPAFVAGCGRLIETQRPNTLSIYLDSLEKLGIDLYNSKGCNNTHLSQHTVLPALLSQDPAFLRILLERGVVMAIMPPFLMKYRTRNSLVSTTNADLIKLFQCLPPQIPHWPLYYAVNLVSDVEFLQLLCRYGPSLQQESSGTENEEQVQGISNHLSRLSSLEDARREHSDTLLLCHMLIDVGIKGVHYSLHSGTYDVKVDTVEYRETWMCMERLLRRDGFLHDIRKGTRWKPKPERLSELMSRYTEFPDLCPKHLRTQSDWDKWREDVLQILAE